MTEEIYVNNEAVSATENPTSGELQALMEERHELMAIADPTDEQILRIAELIELVPRKLRQFDDAQRPGRVRK